jgi:LPS export ABC transporter protein LptC
MILIFMRKAFSYLVFFLIVLLSITSACVNDMKIVNKLSAADTVAEENARDIQVIYSDSGDVQVVMTSPLFNRYNAAQPYKEFPKGIKVIFYNKGMVIKSSLTANYAIMYEGTRIMEARNNVEIISIEKNEKLNTERLVWDERKQKIYSDQFVKVTTKDKVLYGKGFESDQSFDNWVIKHPTGSIQIKQDQ